MRSELEQEFYDTFGIEPKIDYDYKTIIQNVTKTGYWFDKEYLIKIFNDNQKFKVIQVRKNIKYPDITAEKLLEMICIYNNNVYENEKITPSNINTLKEDVLHWIITDFEGNDKFKHQIQQLLQEDNQ